MKSKKELRAALPALVLLVLACLLISGNAGPSEAGRRQSQLPPVTNLTSAFEITTEVRESHLILHLKNVSGKAINGYAWSDYEGVNEGTFNISDYTVGDRAIAPGEVKDVPINLVVHQTWPRHFKLIAVVFEDGTFEGEPLAIERFRNRRAVRKLYLESVIPLIEQFIESPDVETPGALAGLKARIGAASDRLSGGLTDEGRAALRSEEGSTLVDIARLEERKKADPNFNVRADLTLHKNILQISKTRQK